MQNEKLSVLRKVVEQGFGHADLSVIDQLIDDNITEHQFGLRGGKEGVKKAILSLSGAFSNHQYELVHYAVEGDLVWVHYRSTGRHTGPFMGHEPTGNSFSIDVIDLARVVDGKIVEHWGVPDRFALLMQLGFLQPTAAKA